MPTMVMNRNWTVRSTRGHTLRFRKDEPINVPDDYKVIEECQRYGALYADPEAAPALPDEGAQVTNLPKTPNERRSRIEALMSEMKEFQEEHRNHFTAAGRPNAKYVQATLGFDVSAAEVEELWNGLIFKSEDE